jgi:hypothetical protein
LSTHRALNWPWAFGAGLDQQYPPSSSWTSPLTPARNAAGGLSVHCLPAQGLTSAIVVDVVEVLVVEELVVDELVVLEVVELDVVELEVVVV